jgi:hypothetical protein
VGEAQNALIQKYQIKMAYDQQKLNIRASMLQVALQARQTVTVDKNSGGIQSVPAFTADDLVADATKLETYIFSGIEPPNMDMPKIVRV